MRLTLLAQFFPPETFAGANRVHALAAALGREHEVTVVAPRPSYPDPARFVDASEVEPPAGVRLVRVAPFAPHRRSLASRGVAEQLFALRAARAAAGEPADVVVASSPGMFLGVAGARLSQRFGAPFVWDVRDLTWEYAREAAAGPAARLASAALCRLMWTTARRATLLVAATPGIAEILRSRCPGARVVTLENTPESRMLGTLDPSEPAAREEGVVTYAGLVGRAQELSVLCSLAARLPRVAFNVVGDGPELGALVARARTDGLRNLRFHGYLPPERLAAVYRESDVLFAQLHASPLHTRTALPSKLFEYMAAGRPIVYGGDGLAADTIRRIGCGLTAPAGDAGAIGDSIDSLLRDRAAARACGRAGRSFVESQPSREQRMAELLPLLRDLVADAAAPALGSAA